MSARLYIGRWAEHREAAEILNRAVQVHGEGVDTIVRGLLLLDEYQRLQGIHPEAEHGQLLLMAGEGAGAGESAGR